MKKAIACIAIGIALSGTANADMGISASLGDISGVKEAISNGTSINTLDKNGFTPLQMAAWHGHVKLVEMLLDMGADINHPNARGETAIMTAAWQGHDELVRMLLARGAKLDNPDLQWNALHYAAFAGHERVVNTLLTSGANVNLRTTNGSTALMMAAREHHPSIAKKLIAAGADKTVKNDWGDDALAWSLKNRNFDIAKIIDEKIEHSELVKIAENMIPTKKSIAFVGGQPATKEMLAALEEALHNGSNVVKLSFNKPPEGKLTARTGAPKESNGKLVTRSGQKNKLDFVTPKAVEEIIS